MSTVSCPPFVPPRRRWVYARQLVACLLLGFCLPRAVFSLTPSDTAALLHRANNLLEWGRWKEARQLLAQSLSQDPNNPELLAYNAHILTGFGDYTTALQMAQHAVSMNANCAICHLYLSEALGEKAKHLSKLRALLELRKIRKQLEQATALGPNVADVHWGWINFNLEVPAAAGGNPHTAMQQAAALAVIDPVDGHLARATVYLATGQPAQALHEYLQAAQQYPSDPRGVFYVGLTYFQGAQYAAAAPYLERAAKLQPQSSLYAGYYAAVLIHLQKEDQARQVITASAPLHPDSRLPDYLVAEALKRVGQNFVWARELIQRYLATPPEPDQPTVSDARQLLTSLG